MIELVKAAKAIVLVTHDMNWVTEYCNRAILLEQGIVAEGEPAEVVRVHAENSARRKAEKEASWGPSRPRPRRWRASGAPGETRRRVARTRDPAPT